MPDHNERFVAFDSNALTYFLDGNRGQYTPVPGDPFWDQRVAAVRLFLYCKAVIMPTVRAEAERISNPAKLDEHMRFINYSFGEFIPDERQKNSIERRAQELSPHHPKGLNDCRIVAEVEADGDVPVIATWDGGFKKDLAAHTTIRIWTPVECWHSFSFPQGMPPIWTPAPGHPLANETWWRWE
jgi:hypothetical protein